MRNLSAIVPALIACAGLASAAYGATFSATDATLNGSQLTFNVTSPEQGWAVIHLDKNGKPGDHIGHAKIQKGENDKVSVALGEKVESGEKLIVMLHDDEGMPDVFEFSDLNKADKPAMADGKPVIDEITPE